MNPLKNIVAGLAKGSTEGIIKTVADTIDKFTLSKEEKAQISQAVTAELNRHEEKIEELALQKLQAELDNVANARDNNAKIQESEHASWLAKNIAYLIDGAFVVAFFIGLLVILNKVVPESNKELFYTGFGALTSYVGTILTFHRGTSIGSHTKQKVLDKIMSK